MYDSILMSTPMSGTSPQHSDPIAAHRGRRAALSTIRWRREVPAAIRSLGALAGADYADIVTAAIDETPADPEGVVREVLNGVPRGLLLLIQFVQRVFLGFRLKLRASQDHLIGWKIADRGENWLRIETDSWFMTAHVVTHVEAGKISLASFIRYDRRLAAFVWPPVSLIHRQVALILARRAIAVIYLDPASHS
jgi:hypothetical protein